MEEKQTTLKKELLVVKDNDLIRKATYDLSASQQKFLCYVISKIKPTDSEFQKITVSAWEFAEMAGISKKNIYKEFRKMMSDFDNKPGHWIKIGDRTSHIKIFIKPEYNDKQGSVSVILDPDLKQYLLELSSNYTMYELWNILSLKSKHSIRLYELFKSYSYQKAVSFDYEELKSLLCAENYTIYSNFKARILDVSVSEINQYTNLNINYDVIKTGKSHRVTRIDFMITAKNTIESYGAYLEAKARINKKSGQIEGQMSIFDEDIEKAFLRVTE